MLTPLESLVQAATELLDDLATPEDGAQANLMEKLRAAIAKATGSEAAPSAEGAE